MQPICWKCGAPLELIARQPGGVSKYATTTRNWVGGAYDFAVGLASVFRRRDRRYPQVAQVAQWGSQPVAPAEPQSNINTVALERGESRQCTRYRPKTIHDLAPSFAWSAVLGLVSGGVTWAFHAPTETVVGVVSGVTGVSFLASSLPVVWIGGPNVITMLEKLTRTDIDGDGQIGDIAVDLNADLDKEHGNTQKTRVTIPLSQVRAWRKFCQDVTAGECKFSGNAAVAHRLDRAWFSGLIERWAGLDPKRALVVPATVGPKLTPRLTPAGEDRIELDAHAPLPHLMSLLEAMTGTDR